MIVALDGPAGVGKSTIAKAIAEKTGLVYLNSGNFYRAVTLAVIESDEDNEDKIVEIARNCKIDIVDGNYLLNGRNVNDLLHTDRIDSKVAQVSAIVEVREIITDLLRKVAENTSIIMEGRDISTVVFPNADVKVFLDASVETRAKRRYLQGTSEMSISDIEAAIRKRDSIDKNKAIGRLEMAKDAVYLDTSDLTIDEVCETVVSKIAKNDIGPRS